MTRLRTTFSKSLWLAASAILAGAASAQTVDNNPVLKQEVIDQVSAVITKNAFVPGLDFGKWTEFLKQEKPRLDAANNDDEFQRAVNEALHKFGATHMVLNSPRISDLQRDGATVGIGISSERTPDGLLVTRTVPNAPAERGGIVAGDVIIKVDGKPADGAIGISGPEGTDVTVTVRHQNNSTEDFDLTRRRFSTVRAPELTWLDKTTAKLTIYTFDFTYKQQVVDDLMKDGMTAKTLILDLRDNGGGAITNFRRLLGLFLPPSKPVGTFIDRTIDDDYIAQTKGKSTDLAAIAAWTPKKVRPIPNEFLPVFSGKVIVLVNQRSGSASEIVAEGLRDNIGAVIIGSKSAGAVLVSQYVSASNGFTLQYPLSDYVTIRGVRLEGAGVTPDYVVTEPKFHSPDAPDEAVKKALELIKKG